MSRRFAGLLVGLATLAPVTLGVAAQRPQKDPPPASRSAASASATLFEEDDPAVTWTGSWSRNALAANSGGSARLAMEAGAQASFVFNGTGVSWIGYRDEWCGIARVLLDGELQTSVDAYSAPARAQATLYTVNGLSRGGHTLSIQTTGTHNPASAGSWIWVDGFSVAESNSSVNLMPSHAFPRSAESAGSQSRNAATSRSQRHEGATHVEQNDPAVSWSGAWSNNSQSVHSGGNAKLSMETSSRVSVVFNGTAVSWIGYSDQWSGIADVLVDGRFKASVDTYSNPARAQAGLYTVDGLRDGSHTLTIQPTGRHGPTSGGSWIWVDGFTVTR